MLEVIGAISIFGLVYFCVVFVIRAIEDISTHDSVEIVNEHIKKIASWLFNLFQKEEKILDYNFYLGFDGNGNIETMSKKQYEKEIEDLREDLEEYL